MKYSLDTKAKNQEEAKERARAAQILLDNADTENIKFLAELSAQNGVNWKIKTFKQTIKKYLG